MFYHEGSPDPIATFELEDRRLISIIHIISGKVVRAF
jgi:hypothetical protein